MLPAPALYRSASRSIHAYKQDRMTTSESAQSQIAKGFELLGEGQIEDAVTLGEHLASTWPQDVNVLVFASEAHFAQGTYDAAQALLERAIVASGGALALKIKKAGLLVLIRQRDAALSVASDAATQAHANGQALWQIASIITNCNRPADAIPHYERARLLLGEHPGLLYDLAVAQFFTGDFSAADANLDRMLARVPHAGHAIYLRSTLRRQTPASNHVDWIRERLATGLGRDDWDAGAWYALGKELEDLGDHANAFEALVAGARHKRATLQYDIDSECAALTALCAAYSDDAMRASTTGHTDAAPIFIVGMPRTGTTLLERMLVHDGDVKSAGEPLDLGALIAQHTREIRLAAPDLDAAEASLRIDFQALGREYARGVSEAAGTARFIDKMPVNYLYCGLIRKALPNARIIHLTRDPLDSCYAVFKTLFFSAYHFSYDLDELARYYIAYREVMAHWHAVMPGAILDVRYEDLVASPEAQAQRVLAWCGLPWNPEVSYAAAPEGAAFTTASAAQVREPVHARSVRSSRRHLAQLAPLVARLAAAGIEVD